MDIFFWSPNLAEFRPLALPTARLSSNGVLQMSQKALMIAGPLTDADVTELLNTLRKIEQRTQGQIYRAVILDIEREPTIAEMQETIERVFQPTPDRKPRFFTIPKPDAG